MQCQCHYVNIHCRCFIFTRMENADGWQGGIPLCRRTDKHAAPTTSATIMFIARLLQPLFSRFRVKHQRNPQPVLHPRPALRIRRNVDRLELAAVFRCFRALSEHRHRGRSVKPSRENPSNPTVKTRQTLPWRLRLFIRYAILRA